MSEPVASVPAAGGPAGSEPAVVPAAAAGRRTPACVVALAAGALFGLCVALLFAAGLEAIDDAYISFAYARHLVEGVGLVYNPGEYVQGYTNLLWVLILAAGMALGLEPVPLAAGLGLTAGLATLALTAAWAGRALRPGLTAALLAAPLLLAANQGFVVWSVRGLETGLFTLLVLAGGFLYVARGAVGAASSTLFGLAALTRPEGVLAMGLTLAHQGMARLTRREPLLRRADAVALLPFVVLVGGAGVWAWLYYGDPLPNTFHAKVGGPLDGFERGWAYLRKFVDHPTRWALLLLPCALLPRARGDWTRSYAAVMVAGLTLYVLAVGGDVFPAYRFFVPIFPFLYLLVADGVGALEEGARGPLGGWTLKPALALLIALCAFGTYRASSVYAWREWRLGNVYTADMRTVGRFLAARTPAETRLAVNPAGALPWEARRPTIDMLGLNDRDIALTPVARLGSGRLAGHEKGNGASVFARRPDIILIGGVALDDRPLGRNWIPHGRSERELAALPDLYDAYEPVAAQLPDGRWLTFLARRDSDRAYDGR